MLTLNSEQLCAFYAITNKYHDSIRENRVEKYLIEGPGGSGKTYLTKAILDYIDVKIGPKKYTLLAPTNKACSILKKATDRDVSTLAKFFGFSEEITEEGEKRCVYKNLNNESNGLIVVDECSMITKELKEYLDKYTVLYLGDSYQLNPVNEVRSEVFSIPFDIKICLKENKRTADDKLLALNLDFRKFIDQKYVNKNTFVSGISLKNEFIDTFVNQIKSGLDSIIISYTNVSVNSYCEQVRTKLFKKDNEELELYYPGESIIFNEYCNVGGNRCYSSQKETIKNVTKVRYKLNYPRCICDKKSKELNFGEICETDIDTDQKIIKCEKCFTPGSATSSRIADFYKLEFNKFTLLKPCTSEDKKIFYYVLYKYKDRAKLSKNKLLWTKFYSHENMFNANIGYHYAITVHKSQGSGYDHVFIDNTNINFCQKQEEKLRLLYTAVSRASKSVTFLKST